MVIGNGHCEEEQQQHALPSSRPSNSTIQTPPQKYTSKIYPLTLPSKYTALKPQRINTAIQEFIDKLSFI